MAYNRSSSNDLIYDPADGYRTPISNLYAWQAFGNVGSTPSKVYLTTPNAVRGVRVYDSQGIQNGTYVVTSITNGNSLQLSTAVYAEGQVLYQSPEVAASNNQSVTTESLYLQVPGKYRVDVVGGGGGGCLCFYEESNPHWASDGGVGGTISVYLTIDTPKTLTLNTGSGAYARYGRLQPTNTGILYSYTGANSSVVCGGVTITANSGTAGRVSGDGASNAAGVMGTCVVSGSDSAVAVETISINPNTIVSRTENRAVTDSSDSTTLKVRNTNWSANTLMGAGGACCYTTRNTILNATGGQGFIKVTFIDYSGQAA
jgi:hypothetical protein